MVPSKLMLTWDNGRLEGAYIAKRIDRFIIHNSIIDNMGMPVSTIENVFISDHKPISHSWREKDVKYGYPFKFNRTCLEDSAFNEEINKAWQDLSANCSCSPLMTFRDKMAAMRKVVKAWQCKKKQANRQALIEV